MFIIINQEFADHPKLLPEIVIGTQENFNKVV